MTAVDVLVRAASAMRVVGYVLLLVCGLTCNRRMSGAQAADSSAAPVIPGPKIETRIGRTIERFEETYALALKAQARHDAETGVRTKHEGLRTVRLAAASQRRFAQIRWGARYRHGQKALPSVAIDGHVIRCSIDVSGPTGVDAASDWTDFETRIDDLSPGRYRIIAPLHEVTLDVP